MLTVPAHAQIETRAQQLELLRRDKVARLWPERQSEFVNIVNKYVERGLLEDPGQGATGFQPAVLGGMRAGNGLSYGVGYRRTDLWRDRADLRFTARGTPRKAYMFDLRGAISSLQTERAFFDFYAKYENSPRMDYYGPGPASKESDRTSYRLEDTELDLRAGYRLTENFSAAARVGGYFVNTGPGRRPGFPSTDDFFGPVRTPGLLEQTNFLRWGGTLQFDYRDNPQGPRRGGNYYLRFTKYSDRSLRQYSFNRVVGFAEQYFPYHNDTRAVAVRLEGVTAFVDRGKGQRVPFYLQPTLGGNGRLRGFNPYRFYDQTAVLATVEHRWYVFSGLDAGICRDWQSCAPEWTAQLE
jgi:outer membrane protein assembly factor BamA